MIFMTQEDKQLLFKDLCARLPYNTQIRIYNDSWEGYQVGKFDSTLAFHSIEAFKCERIDIKPYLRPMSSMTEEELTRYKCMNDALDENYEVHIDNAYPAFDYLNSIHVDYRGLIEKGLAIEVTESNNPYKE